MFEGRRYVRSRINKYKLTDDDLSAHKKLLECTLFNNIYTTNYDNLIEKQEIIIK